MTLQAALSAFNTEYYNSLTEEQKAEWLEILEKNIYKTIILCHEGGDKIKYIPFGSVPSDKLELLVEDPFSDLYIKYLAMKRDLYFSDIEKYNNSSLTFAGIATLTDIMAAVKRVVFDENKISFADLCALMKNNWQGNEKLRLYCSGIAEKYGNGNATADNIAKEMASFAAGLVNGKPNGRGGIFKAGLFSIDRCFMWGERTAATPDGRRAGEPISKNLCATTAKDKNGITALAASVAKTNLSDFSNGSVLDIIMHPSAVSGEDGLCAMYGVLKTFFGCGGFAMHGNVFDASCLRNAQLEPEKYATLQVRVCGWNVFFVNLSKKEQDEFIKQTEHIM